MILTKTGENTRPDEEDVLQSPVFKKKKHIIKKDKPLVKKAPSYLSNLKKRQVANVVKTKKPKKLPLDAVDAFNPTEESNQLTIDDFFQKPSVAAKKNASLYIPETPAK